MKIKLNLLPKSREKKIRNKKILKFVVLQEIMIILVTILFFGVMKGIDMVANFQLESVNQEILQNGNKGDFVEIKKYEDNLKEAKNNVRFIKQVQKFNVDWTILFNKMATILPEEVTVISIESDGFHISMKGVAKNRDFLIKMKEDMQGDTCFKNINIPLNNIVLRENIDFALEFDVDEKCLNAYEK